jgi:hypothetical protein
MADVANHGSSASTCSRRSRLDSTKSLVLFPFTEVGEAHEGLADLSE